MGIAPFHIPTLYIGSGLSGQIANICSDMDGIFAVKNGNSASIYVDQMETFVVLMQLVMDGQAPAMKYPAALGELAYIHKPDARKLKTLELDAHIYKALARGGGNECPYPCDVPGLSQCLYAGTAFRLPSTSICTVRISLVAPALSENPG